MANVMSQASVLSRCRIALATLCLALLPALSLAQEVSVFAAASLKTALDEVATTWHGQTGTRLLISYAGSSALARQIEAGAPVDIFISANEIWMDYLAEHGHIDANSRQDLLGNQLVLIAPAGSAPQALDDSLPLALSHAPLAMALVAAVPAGIYGKAALVELGLWPLIADQVAQVDNVRAALALVALGEAALGVVYATDADAEPRVTVLAKFPADSHPAIRYPVARVTGSTSANASEFLKYLTGPLAKQIFLRHGFTEPPKPE